MNVPNDFKSNAGHFFLLASIAYPRGSCLRQHTHRASGNFDQLLQYLSAWHCLAKLELESNPFETLSVPFP